MASTSAAIVKRSFVMEKDIHPGLVFEVEITYPRSRIAINSIYGFLELEDDQVLTSLSRTDDGDHLPDSFEAAEQSESNQTQILAGSDTIFDKSLSENAKYFVKLLANLDDQSLERIENIRKAEIYSSVKFKLKLIITYIRSNIRIAHFSYVRAQGGLLRSIKESTASPPFYPSDSDIDIIASKHTDRFTPVRDDGWILSGSGNPIFLKIEAIKVECPHEIDVTSWIKRYLPKLERGKPISFRISLEGDLADQTMQDLSKAEDAFKLGDTKSVFAYCREIGVRLDNYLKNLCKNNSFAYKEKWGRAYANFGRMASLDLHLEDVKKSEKYTIQNISTDESDLSYLLIQTKNLIRYAEKLGEICKG